MANETLGEPKKRRPVQRALVLSLTASAALVAVVAYGSKQIKRPPVVGTRPAALAPSAQTPVILDTNYQNPIPANGMIQAVGTTLNLNSSDWASKRAWGKDIRHDNPFEWIQVLTPFSNAQRAAMIKQLNDEKKKLANMPLGLGKNLINVDQMVQLADQKEDYDIDMIGASGWAFMPQTSSTDNPFMHPFGGGDWEFFIAPDKRYQILAAHTDDKEYVESRDAARTAGHPVPNMLGCEMDQFTVPEQFRVKAGDRVAVWGKWIVDSGHPDFHTEIHPPALLVAARPSAANPTDQIEATLIGRPFLTRQIFESDDKTMVDHLKNEYEKCETFRSTQMEAHPKMYTKPFKGVHMMTFTLRAPSARKGPTDHLKVSYALTVRTGVAVQLINSGDAVSVAVVMNDAQYKPATLPANHPRKYGPSDIKKLDRDEGNQYYELIIFGAINPVAPFFTSRGIKTNRYDPCVPVLAPERSVEVTSLAGNTPGVNTNNVQPFPIAGTIKLAWVHGTQGLKPAVPAKP